MSFHHPFSGELPRACTAAFGTAKRVRTETGVARSNVSISTVAVQLASDFLGELANRLMHPSREVPKTYRVRVGANAREGESRFKLITARWFYSLMARVSDVPLTARLAGLFSCQAAMGTCCVRTRQPALRSASSTSCTWQINLQPVSFMTEA